jgi:transcriptional regulator with XRE-family HTH domain
MIAARSSYRRKPFAALPRKRSLMMSRDSEIGRHLAALRDQAGLKQNELAKRLEWSAAVLSRIESGERPVSEDELEIILSGIGTPQAARVKDVLERDWQILSEPALADIDADLLWEAEQVAQKIHALAERPDVKQFFERRLVRYEEELTSASRRVMDKRYRAAFIGTIAVGKSTAICRVEGLELPSGKGMPKAVLETGAGGITICEVHIRRGPEYGLIIEPCTEDEIRRHVADFANFLLNPRQPLQSADKEDGESGSPGISREVERALRSMTGLRRRRAEKKPDGSVILAVDEARILAENVSDAKALSVEILARMELHKRDRRDIWYSVEGGGKSPLAWLQEVFEHVNNGRHPEFTLPRRIELVVPTCVLNDESLSVTLIDTQGIDDIVGRADLEQHFDDTHTVVVLCTLFNEAPSTSVRQLLMRAKEGGVRTLESNVAILALPRPGDALAMKDNGYPVQTASEGYDLKAEEVQIKLHPLGLTSLPVTFFNAAEDDPKSLRSFVRSRIEAVREFHRNMLREIINGAEALLVNYEREQAREVMMAAARSLTTWLDHNAEIVTAPTSHVHDSLLTAVSAAHPRTVYATVVRDGEWQHLNYAHQLSHGARRIATQLAEPKLNRYREIAANLLHDDQFADAHDLVRQTVRILEGGFDNMLRKAQLVGRSVHADEMSVDAEFWRGCGSEWGRGSGYRDRVNDRNRHWFVDVHHGVADTRVVDSIREEWDQAVTSVRELLMQE